MRFGPVGGRVCNLLRWALSPLVPVGTENSVITPAGVILPILFAPEAVSVNQMFPSGPAAMPRGLLGDVGVGNS